MVLDTTTNTLYLWTPMGDSPANHVVEAKDRTFGFELSGLSYINIQGINLFACSIDTSSTSTHDTINGIQALYVSSFELESAANADNWSLHVQDTGIMIEGSNNILENSDIGYSAGNGVTLLGDNTSLATGNVVTNCVIHDVDYMALDCGGIDTGVGPTNGGGPATSNFNTISDNTIYNSGRDLLVIRNTGSSLILYNNLYDGMLQTEDGGGIYTYGQDGQAPSTITPNPNPDTLIAFNCVHDMPTQQGIYIDGDGSNHYIVDRNLTYDVYYALVLNEPSTYNLVYNNTLIASGISVGGIGGTTPAESVGTYIENNIFTSITYLGSNYANYTNNLPGTTAADFADPAGLNFQLQSDSPAVNAGTVIPGYTNGYIVGSAPDIGCFEYGMAPWTAGANPATNVYAAAVPATPVNLAATSPNASEIDLTWQNTNTNANATSCVVQRSTDGINFTSIVSLPGNATSYADTTLITGTYYYRVQVDNGSFISGYSNCISASSAPVSSVTTIQATNFSAGSGVTASGGLLANCNVGNWAEYANVDFPAGVNPSGSNTAINQITVCYSSTAAAGNTIEFFVDSLSGTLLGSITTQYDPAGGLFTASVNIGNLVAATSITAGDHNIYIVFAGSGNNGLNVANIDWLQFSSVAMPALQQIAAANFTNTNEVLQIGGGAIGYDNNGDWVQYANVYLPASVNQVTLNYTDPNGGGDYIQFRLDSLSNPVIAQDTTQAGYASSAGSDTVSVSGVSAGLHDLYVEFVQNGSGPSSNICDLNWFQFGDSLTVAAPTGATATPAPGLAMNVSWTGNSGNAAGYKIERSTDGINFIQVGTVGPNVTTFQDTGLSSGMLYYYQVCVRSGLRQFGLLERRQQHGANTRLVLGWRRRHLDCRRRWLAQREQPGRALGRWLRGRVQRRLGRRGDGLGCGQPL